MTLRSVATTAFISLLVTVAYTKYGATVMRRGA